MANTAAHENPFPYLTHAEQAGVPPTPPAGQVRKYRDNAGVWHEVDDAGASRRVAPSQVIADGVDNLAYLELPDQQHNGFVVKVAAGTPTYGKGQAFMVLEEGAGDATDNSPTGSVLFRVDEFGSIGTTGGIHISSGLRKYTGTALWVSQKTNAIPILVHNPSTTESASWTQDYIKITNTRVDPAVDVFRVSSDGNVRVSQHVVARDGATDRVRIGSFFGVGAVVFGEAASEDTVVYRDSATVVEILSALQLRERTDPAAPAADRARLFSRDSGGKTQLCVRFNTGAVQVLATEP